MKSFFFAGKPAALVVFVVLAFTLTAASGASLQAGVHYGALQKAGVRAPAHGALQPVKEYAISDADSRALAGGLAPYMLHRVKTPLHVQHPTAYIKASSSNWGGYISISSNITGSVGCYSDTYSPTFDAASWTGVGGVNGTQYLAQAGVDQYYQLAWIDLYPYSPLFVYQTRVGDVICSEVLFDSHRSLWYLNVTDQTTGIYYANEYNFSPDRSSAEWITEAQPNHPVPSFGSVTFGSTYWYNSSGIRQKATSKKGTLYQVFLLSPYGGTVCPSKEKGTSFVNFSNAC